VRLNFPHPTFFALILFAFNFNQYLLSISRTFVSRGMNSKWEFKNETPSLANELKQTPSLRNLRYGQLYISLRKCRLVANPTPSAPQ
jgi:hypothetical protein